MVDLPALFDEVVGDLLTPFSTTAIKAYLKRRADDARRVLLEEVAKARIGVAKAASEDDAIAVVFRFERAIREGTARLNLRLMAKAMVGRLQVGTLVADEFALLADALASLSRDEIILSAELLKSSRKSQASLSNADGGDFRAALNGRGWSDSRIFTTAIRAQRAGFVVMGSIQNTPIFEPGFVLLELAKTVDFEDALSAEGIDRR